MKEAQPKGKRKHEVLQYRNFRSLRKYVLRRNYIKFIVFFIYIYIYHFHSFSLIVAGLSIQVFGVDVKCMGSRLVDSTIHPKRVTPTIFFD